MDADRRFLAPRAWLPGGWADEVLLAVDADGRWSEVRPACPPEAAQGAERLLGPVLPGLVNAHSQAFQRALAGLAERSGEDRDDAERWRQRMHQAALRMHPEQLEAIAAQAYGELLRGGYTHVCEFHELHLDPEGQPYDDPDAMALALVRAAERTGIGLTLLPALCMRTGFGSAGLAPTQRRLASTPDSVLRVLDRLQHLGVATGVAVHSLGAAEPAAMQDLVGAVRGKLPVHIRVAGQRREVEACQQLHGRRPVEWLLQQAPVDARWSVVHATHAGAQELSALRASGAGVVLCPSAEANLGEGLFDFPTWLGASGRWAIGSGSQVTRGWIEELRLLEYGQRLCLRERNIAARAALRESTAAALFDGALEGGSAAAGLPLGGLVPGQRADFIVLDAAAPALMGVPPELLLDALVFSSPGRPPLAVHVAGRETRPEGVASGFQQAMRDLWA